MISSSKWWVFSKWQLIEWVRSEASPSMLELYLTEDHPILVLANKNFLPKSHPLCTLLIAVGCNLLSSFLWSDILSQGFIAGVLLINPCWSISQQVLPFWFPRPLFFTLDPTTIIPSPCLPSRHTLFIEEKYSLGYVAKADDSLVLEFFMKIYLSLLLLLLPVKFQLLHLSSLTESSIQSMEIAHS